MFNLANRSGSISQMDLLDGGEGGFVVSAKPVCGELLILGEISNSPHTGWHGYKIHT